MSSWIVIIALNIGFTASAEKLIYYSPEPNFELERTAKTLTLKTNVHVLKLDIKPCNQPLVEQYWKSAVQEFERQPKINGVPKQGEYAELDNQRRKVMTGPQGDNLRLVGQGFFTLAVMDKRQCL